MFFYNGFDLFFSIVPAIIIIVFVIIAVLGGIKQWFHNNNSPVVRTKAMVVSKRTEVSHHNTTMSNTNHVGHCSTSYYVSFELDTGSRIEFHVQGNQYGILKEGDCGILIFQGTRYLQFDREI